ncbi:hypothetical protein ASZ90_015969 [hydrocarbon metagenome]|uniref:Uncharacterized protein n=1 Tax=hydrocarbon metagenome TaxID=938273 RepID=A0A0W8F0G9_9ZZZZ
MAASRKPFRGGNIHHVCRMWRSVNTHNFIYTFLSPDDSGEQKKGTTEYIYTING